MFPILVSDCLKVGIIKDWKKLNLSTHLSWTVDIRKFSKQKERDVQALDRGKQLKEETELPKAAVLSDQNLGGSKRQKLFSHGPRGQDSKIKSFEGLCCLWRLWAIIQPLPLPSSGGCWHPLAHGFVTATSTSACTAPLLLQGHLWWHLGPTQII